MAEFLGIPYSTIALAAILPCILYYFCCWMSVHLRAQKLGMKGVAKEDLPTADSQTGKAKTPVRAPEESQRRLPQGAEPGQAVSGTGPVQ